MALVALSSGALRAQTAEALYAELAFRETIVRRALGLAPQFRTQPPGEASAALLDRVRTTVDAFENLARRFPRSAPSDKALWHGATLAADAYWQFGDSRDRTTALRLFGVLKSDYPSSALAGRVAQQTRRLEGVESESAVSMLKTIRREVLPDASRITLELDREAIFSEQRVAQPLRVSVDLRNTQPVAALTDATIAFPDDVLRHARIGRQNQHTRVVFDLHDRTRYSIYSLYNPYRIVIDFERTAKPSKPPTAVRASDLPPAGGEGTIVAAGPAPPSSATANGDGGFSLARQLGLGVSRIVIDPGHGGHDPGAQVRGLNEAEVVLDVALRLEKLLLKERGVEVVLTRRTNTYVALEERTAIANRSAADLFVSIHVNGSSNTGARGFETYFLSFAPNPEAEALAARENAGSLQTMANLSEIVKAIALNTKLDESRDFAAMVQTSMYERLRKAGRNVRNLGVKQAPFMVLIGATMPSVLVEVSFLTNRQEAALLRTAAYRQQIAEALLSGVMQYQQSLKKTTKLAAQ
jgi:N-acetylmuramoyl-L-alanine amidase